MRNLLLLFLFLAFCLSAEGQNYQCLRSGVKQYFINGNGYLRGIRIDSVRTVGGSTIYYPFHTPRGSYISGVPGVYPVLDSSGGSWLGKRVLQKSDGTFIFDSYWNDSVIIKTLANVGDSWVFYQDTSRLYYKATVISTGTMAVLSSVDSIKTILITAQNGLGIVTTDPLDSFTIILSKNNGFVQVFDLYTFPYHKPDSAYRPGLDFFLDRSSFGSIYVNSAGGLAPSVYITLFKLVDFVNPTEQQLFSWNAGDIIESDNEVGIPLYGTVTVNYLTDTVTDMVVAGDFINYTISGTHGCFAPATPYSCWAICGSGAYSISDLVYPLMDTSKMPEEIQYPWNYLFYYPSDSSYCSYGPAYRLLPQQYFPGGLGGSLEYIDFKLGIGETIFHYNDGNPTYVTDRLLYYNIHGVGCGTPGTSGVNSIGEQRAQYQLFPNPASTSLTISGPIPINQITITSLIGQTEYTHNYNSPQVNIDVANLPSGMYLVKINGSEVRKFVKQ